MANDLLRKWMQLDTDGDVTECTEHITNERTLESEDCIQVDVENNPDVIQEVADEGSNQLELDISNIRENESQFPGRRIVDVQYIFNQLDESTNITCKDCDGKMKFTEESKRGLASKFHLSCMGCGSKAIIESDQCNNNTQSKVNEAAALGIVSIGSGLYNLQEFLSNLNIPYMSYQTFYQIDKKLQKEWWALAIKLQKEALAEEIQLSIRLNEVDSAGNALIPVKCDGSWHTRSFGSNYKSLAGCAAIIGSRTNKIIYMDVKNKYCHVCKIAQSKLTPANFHECNANYSGPSTGMETEVIVEGFKYCETQGARFHKFIGDGDSSTYKCLRDLRLYKNPVVFIEKFDCLNHLDKNYGKKFRALLKNTKFNQTGRQLLNLKIGNDISKGVRMAAKHWNGTNLTEEEKCTSLERDCMNAPLHVYGVHDNCASYFCTKSTTPQGRDLVEGLKESGLYLEVLNLVKYYFANKAKSLLAGYENNIAESYNSLIAKYLGGKRVNNALAGSYKGRCAIAAVHFNTKGQSTSAFQEFKYNNPQQAVLKLERSRKRKVVQNVIRSEQKPKQRKTDDVQASKKKKRGYGEGHEDLDFTPPQLELATKNFFEPLDRNRQDRATIEVLTRGQRYNSKWSEVRQNLLTSSYFGRILNSRNRKSYPKIVEDILYHNHQYSNTAELVHQRLHEKDALQIFCRAYSNELIDVCGIFIDAKYSFLGASPFRLCGQDGIVSVQCPVKLYKKSIVDSINTKLIPFWTVSSEGTRVNIKSNWYIEIQGQLHISGKKFAYVVVYLGESEYKIEKVVRDDDFWAKEMEKELDFFYNEAMVKELVNSRNERNMELRRYDEITKTFV